MLTDPTRIRLSRAILALAALILFGGCASTTHYASAWRNPEYRGAPLKKVVVFARTKPSAAWPRTGRSRACRRVPPGCKVTRCSISPSRTRRSYAPG